MSTVPNNIDYLAFMQDNCKITVWEDGFCTSCIAWLDKSPSNKLSAKQLVIVDRMVLQYLEEANPDEIIGWRNGEGSEEPEDVLNNPYKTDAHLTDSRDDMASRYTPAQRPPPVDDYDDDIPF